MLRISADVFSGRPNPSWVVTDEAELRSLLKEVSNSQALLTKVPEPDGGLGLRGFRIEPLDDGTADDYDLNGSIYLPTRAGRNGSKAAELGERLLSSMGGATFTAQFDAMNSEDTEHGWREYIAQQLHQVSSGQTSQDDASNRMNDASSDMELAAAAECQIETGVYNPAFWNDNPTTRTRNNCYNYASNRKTDTFAQPGRGSGQIYSSITCPAVTQASLRDGLHRRGSCFPDTEKPRYLIALVVAPGPGVVDFHWYRKHTEGFWGHKPGSTNARNTDNSGNVITNPETCDRGPYTLFCGYFYTCKGQVIN